MDISIVVPVHNSAPYLRECLESLSSQITNLKYEVILIDNDSYDESTEILEEYCQKDSMFRYFFLKTKGVSSARNLGISVSRGKYITFVDSDDIVSSNYLNDIKIDSDLICLSYSSYTSDKTRFTNYGRMEVKKNGRRSLLCFYQEILKFNSTVKPSVWGKLFIAEIIKKNKIVFDTKIEIGEDFLFLVNYLSYFNESFEVQFNLNENYFYRIHNQSAMKDKEITEKNQIKFSSEFIMLEQLSLFLPESLEKNVKLRTFMTLNSYIKIYDNEFSNKIDVLTRMKLLVKENILFVLKSNSLSVKAKVRLIKFLLK